MAKRTYSTRGLITRTMHTTSADVTIFNNEARELTTARYAFTGKYNEQAFMKKAASVTGCPVLCVENLTSESKLYGITPEKFLEVATEITDNEEK